MSNIIKAIILLGCAFVIAIQQDELGEALIQGYHGLFYVLIILTILGLYHVWSFVSDIINNDDDDDIDWD